MHIKSKLFFITYFFLCSCGVNQASQENPGEIRVRLPLSAVQNDNQTASYSFQVVPLLQINSLSQMRGAYARFFTNPSEKESKLVGTSPRADFLKNTDGVYIPKNEISQQMASIYYHMQNMALFDKSIGAEKVNHWPRDIGLRVQLQTSENSTTADENNAIYDGQLDAILIVPYNENKIPLSVNGGVLAHEHFHSLFYKLVTKKLLATDYLTSKHDLTVHTSSDSNIDAMTTTLVVLKGLNEGLADFWGWAYTQDNDFILHSLSSVGNRRSLKISALENENFRFKSPSRIQQELSVLSAETQNEAQDLVGYAYSLGTDFAKSMKLLSLRLKSERKISDSEAQGLVAKAVFVGMKSLADTLIAEKKSQQESALKSTTTDEKSNSEKAVATGVSIKTLFLQFVNSVSDLKVSECEWAKSVLAKSDMIENEKCQTIDAKVSLK